MQTKPNSMVGKRIGMKTIIPNTVSISKLYECDYIAATILAFEDSKRE